MATALRSALLALVLFTLLPSQAGAVTCARGVYRAGCVGPNGGAVVRRPYGGYHGGYYGHGGGTACARGPNGAGCVHRRY